jgi:peptide subunit release factor RF-3
MVVFAPQNVIKDPPFTKLDILTCRNMLIYMEPALQKKLMSLFNYSLNEGGIMLLGAFGQLQFEVVAHRLKSEYGAEVRLLPARYSLARWVSSADPIALKKFTQENIHRMAEDVVGAAVFLATHKSELDVAQQRWESIEFHALREHAGLIYQSELAG